METTIIRAARLDDIGCLMDMYSHSRSIMRRNGNASQWVNGYPDRSVATDDIRQGHSFIIEHDGKPVGTFAFIQGLEPTYANIYEGNWEEPDRPYATIHRIACAPDCHGIFSQCIDWCRQHATSLRIDTHADNTVMLHLIPKHDFLYRGIIYISDGTPRMAFQMLNTKAICLPLQEYVESQILPRYANFDAAHRRDHADTVIANSLQLAAHYDVDINMAYTVAAYHDTGLCEGRERHHIVSGEILTNDVMLKQWFSPSQLEVMRDAIEDHRASAAHAPRSIYGRIVAEADRDIEPEKIVRRTIQFGLSHYPDLDKESQWKRTVEHLEEKYGDNGYLQLWIPESGNAARLAELRRLIADRKRLRLLFEQIIEELTIR